MRRLFAVLALGFLVAACQDQPTAPSDGASLDPSLHRTHGRDIPRPPGHGWSLLYYEDALTTGYAGYPLPCLDTPTETVTGDWYGRWYWWMKNYDKTWLRGKPMRTRVMYGADTYFLDSKGRRWDLIENYQTILITRTNLQSTAWTGPNPSTESYINRSTGERFRLHSYYLLGGDHLPPPVEYTMFETVDYGCDLVRPGHRR